MPPTTQMAIILCLLFPQTWDDQLVIRHISTLWFTWIKWCVSYANVNANNPSLLNETHTSLHETPEVCRWHHSHRLIQESDETAYRQEIKRLALWCGQNHLKLSTLKTMEMTVDFRRSPPTPPPSQSSTAQWLLWTPSGFWKPKSPGT